VNAQLALSEIGVDEEFVFFIGSGVLEVDFIECSNVHFNIII
jgi:hypothetical protein